MFNPETASIPEGHISQPIRIERRRRVLLDVDAATLYRIATKHLNEQIKRNLDRVPEDSSSGFRAPK